MPRHKDFEIWYDEERQRYRFSVEYWGTYSGKTLKEIQNKVVRVKYAVKNRLKEIEEENKAYYARLAKQEEDFRRVLKRYKEEQKLQDCLYYNDLRPAEQRLLTRLVCKGADELEIKKTLNVNSATIAQIRIRENRKCMDESMKQ